jgi:hypothetical protein
MSDDKDDDQGPGQVVALKTNAQAVQGEAMKAIEQLYNMAKQGKVRDVAFVATYHDDPDKFIWAISNGTHLGRLIGHLALLQRRAVDRLLASGGM